MKKALVAILFLFLPALGIAESPAASSAYQPATVTQVKPYQGAEASNPDQALYQVSLRVNGATYVVLTAPPSGESTIMQVVGRELLVMVGDDTITWNDIMGRSHVVPIVSKTTGVDHVQARK